jgi:hypothetical protein
LVGPNTNYGICLTDFDALIGLEKEIDCLTGILFIFDGFVIGTIRCTLKACFIGLVENSDFGLVTGFFSRL